VAIFCFRSFIKLLKKLSNLPIPLARPLLLLLLDDVLKKHFELL